MNTQQHAARDENLQILRFVAAALVLVTHITFYIGERIQNGFPLWNGGEAGVPIFFVISGFVMQLSGSRLSRDATGARQFLRRRVARVFPMYWMMTTLKLAVAIAVPAAVLHNRPDLLSTLASYALFPMLNAEGEVRPLHGVGWTLLHEMFFYYVFALALWLRQLPLLFCSIVIGGLWLIGLAVDEQAAFWRVCFSSLNLLFLCGMVLGALYQRGRQLPPVAALAGLAAAVWMLSSADFRALNHALLASFNVGAVLLVGSVLSLHTAAAPRLRAGLAALGDSSYSLYMIHPILAPALCVMLAKLHLRSPYVVLTLVALLCVAIAHLVYRLVEQPLNRSAVRLLGWRHWPAFVRN